MSALAYILLELQVLRTPDYIRHKPSPGKWNLTNPDEGFVSQNGTISVDFRCFFDLHPRHRRWSPPDVV